MKKYQVGDHVVYHKPKHSTHPGPRAVDLHPAPQGDEYSYIIDKFWTVIALINDHTIEVRTRKGKTHQLNIHDPLLRKAGLLEGWFFRNRFPPVEGDKAPR